MSKFMVYRFFSTLACLMIVWLSISGCAPPQRESGINPITYGHQLISDCIREAEDASESAECTK